MKIHESREDYLETILILHNKQEKVISLDVANYMGYSKASISRAMKNLRVSGYIIIDSNGNIELTESGLEIANNIYERHQILSKLFMSIGVSEKTALEDACRVEHYLSKETFEAIKRNYKEQN